MRSWVLPPSITSPQLYLMTWMHIFTQGLMDNPTIQGYTILFLNYNINENCISTRSYLLQSILESCQRISASFFAALNSSRELFVTSMQDVSLNELVFICRTQLCTGWAESYRTRRIAGFYIWDTWQNAVKAHILYATVNNHEMQNVTMQSKCCLHLKLTQYQCQTKRHIAHPYGYEFQPRSLIVVETIIIFGKKWNKKEI